MTTVRVDLDYHISFLSEGSGMEITDRVEAISRYITDAVSDLAECVITCKQQRTTGTTTVFDNMSL